MFDTVKNTKNGKTYGPEQAKKDGVTLTQWKKTLQALSEKKMFKHLRFSISGTTETKPAGVKSVKEKAAEKADNK